MQGKRAALEISYTFRFSDYDALSDALRPARRRKIMLVFFWLVMAANFAAAALIAVTTDLSHASVNAMIGVLMLLAFFIFVPMLRRWNFRRLNLDGKQIRISIGDEGVRSAQQGIEGTFQWSAFTRFSRSGNHAFLWINRLQALILPFDAFKSEMERDAFLNFTAAKIPLER
jgi:YcxB-like protein